MTPVPGLTTVPTTATTSPTAASQTWTPTHIRFWWSRTRSSPPLRPSVRTARSTRRASFLSNHRGGGGVSLHASNFLPFTCSQHVLQRLDPDFTRALELRDLVVRVLQQQHAGKALDVVHALSVPIHR